MKRGMTRRISAAGLFALLLILFGGTWDRAEAQPVPRGSYLQSCRDVQVRGGRDLTALCETRQRGVFNRTRLDNFRECRGDIMNSNGRLWCERRHGPGPRPQPVPPGSYLRTCANAGVAGPWLTADCRDMNGRWRAARLNLNSCRPRSDIANINGALVCR